MRTWPKKNTETVKKNFTQVNKKLIMSLIKNKIIKA